MKPLSVILFALVCYTSTGLETTPHISVVGSATIQVTPDTSQWLLSVKNNGPALQSVASKHSQTVTQVLDLLKKLKIDSDAAQTTRMQFGENWQYLSGSRVKQGYFAATNISFKSQDFSNYSSIWSGLSNIPAVSVNRVSYDISDRIKHQNDTREKALLAAQQKANNLARAIGSRIGAPLLIEELYANHQSTSNVNELRVAAAPQGPGNGDAIAIGKIEITMRIKAAFSLLDDNQL